MPKAATPEQCDAQRRIVSIITMNRVLNRGGLALWRDDDSLNQEIYGSADADDVAADLETLGVRSTIVPRYMPPRAQEKRPRKGREVRIAWPELATLVHWMPSLKERMEELPEDANTHFEFLYVEPRPEGMAICPAMHASRWPWWTEKQARKMGLMCADCGCDLRPNDRTAYRIADSEGRRRLYCGTCCSDGVDALAALTGQSS
ncbi:hypothetical protein [Streptomyces sp. NPDC059881]|uniref:hypothetical protein n=1 Tax=Streptomyces sp. NPDC059881 TaxID=3346986 RepID=UPI00365D5BD8